MNEDINAKTGNGAAIILAVAAAALAVRLIHVVMTVRFNAIASDLVIDAAVYDRWAQSLAFGGAPVSTQIMQSPLYPWFLSLIYRLFGADLTAVRIAQAILGTASCVFVSLITRRFFGAAAALIAGLFAAFYLPAVFYEGVLVPATIVIFLNLLFVVLLVSAPAKLGKLRLLLAGAVLGISAVARPTALLIFPFAALYLLFVLRGRGGKSGAPRSAAETLALFTFGLVIALAPLAIRNTLIMGEFTPLTTGGGISFYIGANPKANGFFSVPVYKGRSISADPEVMSRDIHEIASAEAGRELGGREMSQFWFRAGLRYGLEHPGRWAALTWQKFVFFWNRYERANVESFSLHRRFRGVLQLPFFTFGLIAPLGLIGIFLTRERWRELWLLYGGVLAYMLLAVIFYVLSRYRLPVVSFLLPFAGACIVEMAVLVRKKRFVELFLVLAALAAVFYFTNYEVASDTPHGISSGLTRIGNAHLSRGEMERAIDAYREAIAVDPGNHEARANLETIAP